MKWILGCICMYVWASHIARVWINRSRLPILLVVSWTGKINTNIFLSAFAPENLVSLDGIGGPVPRQPAHFRTQAESGACLRDSSRVPRRRPFIYLNRHMPWGQSQVYRAAQMRSDGVHCRESAGTGPVNLKVVPNGCCLGLSFPHPLLVIIRPIEPLYWYCCTGDRAIKPSNRTIVGLSCCSLRILGPEANTFFFNTRMLFDIRPSGHPPQRLPLSLSLFFVTSAVEPATDLSHVRLICMGFGILPDAKSLAGTVEYL